MADQNKADTVPVRERMLELESGRFRILEEGRGPAVLFCHGFPDTAETWRRQMHAVSRVGYRAIALDMRGYGGSAAPEAADLYSALHTAGDIVGVLDALGIDTAVLVGHDWGADVAQRAMVLRPDRFRAIVSISIPFAWRGNVSFYESLRLKDLEKSFYAFELMRPEAAALFEPAEASILSTLYWLSGSPAPDQRWDPADPARHMLRPAPAALPEWADPDYVRRTIETFTRTGFHGGLNYYRAAQATFDLMPAFRNAPIRQPSLYIWGAADGLCRFFHPQPPGVDDMRAAAPGLVDIIQLKGVGHWIQHEASERLNAEILAFLDKIGAAE